jgi:biopolymer transport protein ExbB
MRLYGVLMQLPGVTAPHKTWQQWVAQSWHDTGWMVWPLTATALIGIIVAAWKFFNLMSKASRTRRILKEVDELLTQHRVKEALDLTRDTNAPAARILYAGLERHEEGTERIMKAIENQGLLEMSKLEKGLVVLATVTNIAPLLGFLGTVLGMIIAFASIQAAGEVEATAVAGGIKIALYTTAYGLMIAIPISIAHNYFVSRIDALVIDMEESAQKMVDILHAISSGKAVA